MAPRSAQPRTVDLREFPVARYVGSEERLEALLAAAERVVAAETWLHLIEHLDDQCVAGVLDAEPAPAEDRALRRWLANEVAGQLRGTSSPTPFSP